MQINKFKTARLIIISRYLNRLSQEELAKKAGISRRTLHRYETANVFPQPGILEKIGSALGIPKIKFLKEENTGNYIEADKKYIRHFGYLKDLAGDRRLRRLIKFYTENREEFKGMDIYNLLVRYACIPDKQKRYTADLMRMIIGIYTTHKNNIKNKHRK